MSSISKWEWVVLGYVGLLFALGIGLAIGNTPYYDQVYSVEDGVLEWLTALALAQTALVSWVRFWRFSGLAKTQVEMEAQAAMGSSNIARPKSFIVSLLMCSLLFTFGFGEEISWGQRLLNVESNAFFSAHNAQGETNLHNLVVGGHKVNKIVFGKGVALFFLIYLLILTPLYWRSQRSRRWMDAWAVPIPKGYQLAVFAVILIGVEGVIQIFSDTGRRGELTEFTAAFAVMLVIVFPFNRQNFEYKPI